MGYIYKISNDITPLLYIGKTVTTITHRWLQHKGAYAEYDWHIYRAMRAYGIEHFHIECVEECADDILNERERYWISYYNSYKNGYNMTEGGDGRVQINREYVKVHWELGESVKTIASALEVWSSSIINILKQLEIYDQQEVRRRAQIDIGNTQAESLVYYYEPSGKLIHIYNSIKEASSDTKENPKSIRNAANQKIGLHGKFWSREPMASSDFHAVKIQKNAEIEQYNLKGEYLKTFPNASEAARAVNGDSSGIIKVCRGKRKTHAGYIWKYKEKPEA